MDSAGDFVIAFQGYDSNSHGVFAERFNASGAARLDLPGEHASER